MISTKKSPQLSQLKIIALTFCVFLFAFAFRLWNLNLMGVVTDESWYLNRAYKFHQHAVALDFMHPDWYKEPDHPPLAKYIYAITAPLDVARILPNGEPEFKYDRTHTRVTSALFGSMGVVLVFLIGFFYVSVFVGIAAAVILAMIPVFIGVTQLATLESVIFFFYTATVLSFLKFLEFPSRKMVIITGILAGLTLEAKQNTILIFPLLLAIYFLYNKFEKKKKNSVKISSLVIILSTALITFILLWPMAFLHPNYIATFNYYHWFRSIPPPPEVFFGFVMFSPIVFYPVMYIVTTPLLLIFLHLIGLKSISDRKKWILYSFILWFLFPFLLSFHRHRQHGVRNIIEFYAPFSLIAAIGLETITNKIRRTTVAKIISLLLVIAYLFVVLKKITPYYLDYYNIIPGGARGVAEKEMFALGWWGQGYREAGLFLERTAPKGAIVGLAPGFHDAVFPVPDITQEPYDEKKEYDYIITSSNGNVKGKFQEETLNANYRIVYSVKADGASLVDVYKSKK